MDKTNGNPTAAGGMVVETNTTDSAAILTKYNESSSSGISKTNSTTTGSNGGGAAALPRGRIDLMDLQDFDVQIALTVNLGVQIFEVTDIVTSWMNDSFRQLLLQAGYVGSYADFDTIILLERNSQGQRQLDSLELDPTTGRPLVLRREKQLRVRQVAASNTSAATTTTTATTSTGAPVASGTLFTAHFKGAALFTRQSNQTAIPLQVVQDMETITLQQKRAALLQELKAATYAVGLGPTFVVDVRTDLATGNVTSPVNAGNTNSGSSLQLVIIIAIVIACVAFVFLLMAIFWAWKYDKRNRQAYLAKGRSDLVVAGSSTTGDVEDPDIVKGTTPRTTKSSTANNVLSSPQPPVENIRVTYPREIGVVKNGSECYESSLYPESVISEDISTSLSQYYQQSMVPTRGSAALASATAYRQQQQHMMINDAASVSSMESYGYSLDGYAPSLHTLSLPTDSATSSSNNLGAQVLPSSPRAKKKIQTQLSYDE